MDRIVSTISSLYNWAYDDAADPRTKDWFLVRTPCIAYGMGIMYLIVAFQGPKFMKNRNPLNIKYIMIAYNFFLVLLSLYMFKEFLMSTWTNFNWACQPVDYSRKPQALRLASVCWFFFVSKLIEMADTFMFIARKKNNQLTFLHIYHHLTMPLLWWIGVRWLAGGVSFFSAMVNCFVHIFMYLYYMLSAFGPQMQKYLWWKKYITILQLVQFVMIITHCFVALYLDCGYPRTFIWGLIFYATSHILLFSNFFTKTYSKGKGRGSKRGGGTSSPATPSSDPSGRYNLRQRAKPTPAK